MNTSKVALAILVLVISLGLVYMYKQYNQRIVSKHLSDAGLTNYGIHNLHIHEDTLMCSPKCSPMGECIINTQGTRECQCQFPFTGPTCDNKIEGWHNTVEQQSPLTQREIVANRHGCQVLKEPSACSFLRFHGIDPYGSI